MVLGKKGDSKKNFRITILCFLVSVLVCLSIKYFNVPWKEEEKSKVKHEAVPWPETTFHGLSWRNRGLRVIFEWYANPIDFKS